MVLRELEIERFRGISNLKLRDLPQIVIFGGRNSCGKTTVLEAMLLMFLGTSCAHLIQYNRNIRGIFPVTMEDIKKTFFNGLFDLPICFRGILGTGEKVCSTYRLVRKLNYSISTENAPLRVTENLTPVNQSMKLEGEAIQRIDIRPSTETVVEEYELQSEFKKANARLVSIANHIGDGYWEIQHANPGFPVENASAAFLPAFERPRLDISTVKQMFDQGGDKLLLEMLQKVDRRVEAIHLIETRLMVRLKGTSSLFPVQILGDGVSQIANIVVRLIHCKDNGICCIDEIGNGLHYSICERLWDAIFDFARKHAIQIIVTTHREDVLRAFAEVCTKQENASISSAYINLIRNPITNNLEEFRYQPLDLLTAMDAGLEVR